MVGGHEGSWLFRSRKVVVGWTVLVCVILKGERESCRCPVRFGVLDTYSTSTTKAEPRSHISPIGTEMRHCRTGEEGRSPAETLLPDDGGGK